MAESQPNEQTPIIKTGKDTHLDILNSEGNVDKFLENPFGEKHDRQFWDDVCTINLELFPVLLGVPISTFFQ